MTQGPARRFFLQYLLAKPLLGSFAAIFVFLFFSSHLIISIVSQKQMQSSMDSGASIQLVVPTKEDVLFAYATLAIFAGFAADKLVRGLMDKVSARINQTGEKRQSFEADSTGTFHGRAPEHDSRTTASQR